MQNNLKLNRHKSGLVYDSFAWATIMCGNVSKCRCSFAFNIMQAAVSVFLYNLSVVLIFVHLYICRNCILQFGHDKST